MRKTIIALAATVAALTTVSAQTSEGIFEYGVGDYRVLLLSDGQREGNTRVLVDAPADLSSYLSPQGTYPSATNAFALVSPRGVILLDAGTGSKLSDNLRAAGISKIDEILLTHMHGDHIGGLLTDGRKAFDGAPLSLGVAEAEYWEEQGGNAKTVLDLYKPRKVELYTLENVPADRDGLFPIEAYGHTPGHTAWLLVSRGEKLLLWGDITHAMAVQMPRPEISVSYDVDPDMARVSRLKIFEYAAENNIPVAGAHIARPAIGLVEKAGEGYRFVPVAQER